MKSAAQVGVIAGVAFVLGLGHWLVDGRPSGMHAGVQTSHVAQADPGDTDSEKGIYRDYGPLRDGEIRLSEVGDESAVVWMDARRKDRWERDGMPGSIHVTTVSEEPIGDQLSRHFDKLLQARLLVIYCDDYNCPLSHDLMEMILRDYADMLPPEVKALHGGHVALKDARRIKNAN